MLVKADPTFYGARNFVAVHDLVYFQTQHADVWRTDGTDAGTFVLPIKDFMHIPTAAGNFLYFFINRPSIKELWRSDGTPSGTGEISTFYPKKSSLYNPVAVSSNILYFVADDGVSRNEVWRTDGTDAGTYQVADLNSADNPAPSSSFVEDDIRSLAIWNGHLYIGAFDDTDQWALYKSDGTKGNAVKVIDLFNSVEKMIPTGNRLHFF